MAYSLPKFTDECTEAILEELDVEVRGKRLDALVFGIDEEK